MFCRNCGKEISNESKFCRYCGTEVTKNNINESSEEIKKFEKAEFISINSEKNNIKERALQIKNSNEYEKKIEKIKQIAKEFNLPITEAKNIFDSLDDFAPNSEEKLIYSSKVSQKTSNIEINNKEGTELLKDYTCIKNKLVLVSDKSDELYRIQVDIQSKLKNEKEIREKFGLVGKLGVMIFAMFIVISFSVASIIGLIVGGIIGFIIYSIMYDIDKKRVGPKNNQLADEYHKNNINPLIDRFNELKLEIDFLWESEELLLYEKIIPDEYKSIDAINFFVRALQVGRASNQKEVFNLYEEELHKRKMISMQNEMLIKQDEQIELSKTQNEKLDNINKTQNDSIKLQKKISKQVRYGNAVSTLDLLTADKVKIKR